MSEPTATSFSEIFTNIQKPVVEPWREVALLALMVTELSWYTPWYRTLTLGVAPTSHLRAFGVFGAIALGASLLARGLRFLNLKLSLQRLAQAVGLLVAGMAALLLLQYPAEEMGLAALLTRPLRSFADLSDPFPGEFIVLLAAMLVWWRGMVLGHELKGVRIARSSFQFGASMLILYVLLHGTASEETPGAFLYLFLFSGLVAMGTARIAALGSLRGGRPLPFERRWLMGFVGSAALAVILAAMVAFPASFAGAWAVRLVAGLALGLLLLVTVPILLALTFVFFWILGSLDLETSPFAQALQDTLVRLREMISDLGALFRGYFSFLAVLGDWWRRWAPELRLVFCVGILLVLGVVIVLRMRPGARRASRGLWPLPERTDEELDLWSELRRSLQNRLRELASLLAGWDQGRRDARQAAARIRRIYAQLLDLGARLETPRPPAVTPGEYLPALQDLFPTLAADLGTLTLAYERVRYGELPEGPQVLDRVEAAWTRVKAEGRHRLSARTRNTASG